MTIFDLLLFWALTMIPSTTSIFVFVDVLGQVLLSKSELMRKCPNVCDKHKVEYQFITTSTVNHIG